MSAPNDTKVGAAARVEGGGFGCGCEKIGANLSNRSSQGAGAAAPAKKKEAAEDELTPEDRALRENLTLAVGRVVEPDAGVRRAALGILAQEIRTATSSMTSVPKPLKFLLPHYDALVAKYRALPDGEETRADFADVLSVLAMTMAHGRGESLAFKLAGVPTAIEEWGHEYVRNLAGEIGVEFAKRRSAKPPGDVADLLRLVDVIVPYNMKHNAGHEAVDLLIETECIERLAQYLDADNYERVVNYLLACATYLTEPDDQAMLRLAFSVLQKFGAVTRQMAVALRLRDLGLVRELFEAQLDPAMRRQLGYVLAREQLFLFDEEDDEEAERLVRIVRNGTRSELFRYVVADVDVKEAKTPDDVYKADLANRVPGTGTSAKQNLASTFVNGWLNCGFGTDKLLAEDGNKWIYKNKERGQMCATASLGLIHLWDPDVGCNVLDAFSYTDNENVKAGLLLGVGVANAQVKNAFETALGMCSEGLGQESPLIVRVASLLGLGLAYAGTGNTDVSDVLRPIFEQPGAPMELVALAGLSLGLVFVGSANAEVSSAIVENGFFDRSTADLESSTARLLCLGLGLTFLGRGDACDVSRQTLQAILEKAGVRQFAGTVLDACAYAGTGNVLKIQQMLQLCAEHPEAEQMHQSAAVLGIAIVAFGEPLGQQMCLRTMDHLLQYGDPVIRRTVPLALALLSVSAPDVTVMDKLSKLSHDNDPATAQAAIFGLGVIGGGTNNSRIAALLRSLAEYYYKDADLLFCVRLAQGLLHLGKGTLTLNPTRQQGMFTNPGALAGLITTLFLFTDFQSLVITRPYLLFALTLSLQPRMLVTLDADTGKPVQVNVRVGRAVDTVGMAGKPKTLTGFQTFTTPVLLSNLEGAELATEEYVALTSVLEDVVLLRKNPNWKAVE